jgi:protein dithiol:quinone oxidoreductase
MHLARTRSLFFLAFFACASGVAAAFYLERVAAGAPCPLCFVQRALLLVCSGICLVAALHKPGQFGWRVYSGVLFSVALTGAAIAARQVWLQDSPPDNPVSCIENLQHLLDTQPYLKVVYLTLVGSAGCSEITWSLFGISVPEWSLLAFSGISLFALYYLFIEFRSFASMNVGSAD